MNAEQGNADELVQTEQEVKTNIIEKDGLVC